MTQSIIHRKLMQNNVERDIVDILGPNYETVLNFWHYVETISKEEYVNIRAAYEENCDAMYRDTFSHKNLLEKIVDSITVIDESTIWNNCHVLHNRGLVSFDACSVVSWATHELICMHKLLEDGHKLLFVPLFNKH
jgi:hypothetical protein